MSETLDFDKPLYTKRGGVVEGLVCDERNAYPNNGYELFGGLRIRSRWTAEGRYWNNVTTSDRDLTNTPPDGATVPESVQSDPVNRPAHYTQGGIECIDAIQAALTPDAFNGFCLGNALKYIWRHRMKGGQEDLDKAIWYLEKAKGEQ